MVSIRSISRLAIAGLAVAILIPACFGQPVFTGAQTCKSCHAQQSEAWSQARHGKMLQPATSKSVVGDFRQREVQLRGSPYRFRESGGAFYITESYLTGTPQEHRIDYTLGSRRVQHYLTKLPDGRIIVLPPSWDVTRKQWFHNLEIVAVDETALVPIQVWNKTCYGCHVSRASKGFDVANVTYNTTWTDFGTSCERCHGPGSTHIADHQNSKGEASAKMVQPEKLAPAKSTMVCAQCHSLRDIVADGFTAGSDYSDFYQPILEYGQKHDKDPAYWPDGRTRRFSNDAVGLWQSQCFLKGGATCVACHSDVHDPEIEKNVQLQPSSANTLCLRCHASVGARLAQHTHHAPTSAGSACVECHMPRTVYSVKAEIRDHSMSVPVPENTIRFGIPNACNVCHKDKDANWALDQMKTWSSGRVRQKYIRRAEAFTLATAGKREAIEPLLAILDTTSEGPVVRANAAGHISKFGDDPRVRTTLLKALTDPDPRVRTVAALRVQPAPGNLREIGPALVKALNDPARSVRAGAATSLLNFGVKDLPGVDGQRYTKAKSEAAARFDLQSDDADEQFNAGKFFYLTGDSARATASFQSSAKLSPKMPVAYFLALVLAQTGKVEEARKRLEAIPASDPYYKEARAMLITLN